MFLGYIYAPYLESYLQPMVNNFRDRVQGGEIKLTMESIFFNNFYVATLIYFGAIPLGLITATLLISNGVFIGYFATKLPLYAFLILTLPHGILEIPGIIIAGAGGFTITAFIIYFLKDIFTVKKNEWGEMPKFRDRLIISFNNNSKKLTQSLTLFGVAVILLIIAAFIEVYITINLAEYILSF